VTFMLLRKSSAPLGQKTLKSMMLKYKAIITNVPSTAKNTTKTEFPMCLPQQKNTTKTEFPSRLTGEFGLLRVIRLEFVCKMRISNA